MTYSLEAISLFRAALRTVHRLPSPIKGKLAYNVREMFEVYKDTKDQAKRTHVLQEGWHDVGVLREVMKAEPAILEDLFKHFDAIPDTRIVPGSDGAGFNVNSIESIAVQGLDVKAEDMNGIDTSFPHLDDVKEVNLNDL